MGDHYCFVFIRLGPYHHARLNAVASVAQTTCIESDPDSQTYAWQDVSTVAGYRSVRLGKQSSWLNTGQALDAIRPTVLFVSGWAENGVLEAITWGRRKGVPVVMMADSQTRDSPRVWYKEWIKRAILSCCNAALVAGSRHVEYLSTLGVSPRRMALGYDVVDNSHFKQARQGAQSGQEVLRATLKLPKRYFLACCRFIPEKNLHTLLHAYKTYQSRAGSGAWHLVLVGDGPLRSEIEATITSFELCAWTHLVGFQQYETITLYYTLASAFVLPSISEPWGLVVNEAMASGLPVLVSEACGCVPELVQNGSNGFTFEPMDETRLAALLQQVSENPESLSDMGETSREIISHWDLDRFVDGVRRSAAMANESCEHSFSGFGLAVLHILRLCYTTRA